MTKAKPQEPTSRTRAVVRKQSTKQLQAAIRGEAEALALIEVAQYAPSARATAQLLGELSEEGLAAASFQGARDLVDRTSAPIDGGGMKAGRLSTDFSLPTMVGLEKYRRHLAQTNPHIPPDAVSLEMALIVALDVTTLTGLGPKLHATPTSQQAVAEAVAFEAEALKAKMLGRLGCTDVDAL